MRSSWLCAGLLAGVLWTSGLAHAEVLAGWYFENGVPPGTEMQLPDDGVFGGFARRNFTQSPGFFNPVGNGSPRGWSSSSWTAGDYVEFWTGSGTFQNIVVSWDQARNNNAPTLWDLEYSTDNETYHTLLNDYTVLNNGTPNAAWSSVGPRNPVYTRTVNLPAAASNQGTLILRIVAQQTATTGSIVIDNFTVTGTPAPEPTAMLPLAALLVGALRRR